MLVAEHLSCIAGGLWGNGSPMDVTNKNITLSGEEFQIEHTLSWQLVSQKRWCISIHKKSHLEHDDRLVGKYVKGSHNDGDFIFCSFAINDFPTKPSMSLLSNNNHLDDGNEEKQVGEDKEYDDCTGKDIFYTRFVKYSPPSWKQKLQKKSAF